MNAAERVAAKAAYGQALGRPFATRADFLRAVQVAVQQGQPLAAGRLGHSPQYWLAAPLLHMEAMPPLLRRTLAARLWVNAEHSSGIFPGDENSMQAFVDFYVPHVRALDWLGLTLDQPQRELPVLQHYGFAGQLLYYQDVVPDRSVPSDDRRCYLPHLAGQHLLLVCPFANVLKAQATQATFEAVWAKTGKRWFHPAAVTALEFPYGFEPETQRRFGTAINLFDHIVEQMATQPFDVAFIAASGLAIPLAAAARAMGKIGIDLGGDLQILFGVYGNRWRARADWQRDFFNAAWIDVPAHYQPSLAHVGAGRSYW